MNILVLNAGSSSQKSCLYRVEDGGLPENPPSPIWEGRIEQHDEGSLLTAKSIGPAEARYEETLPVGLGRAAGLEQLLTTIWTGPTAVLESPEQISVVGHRVVHGGDEFTEPTLITPEVKNAIARWSPLAPAHNPAAIEGIEAAGKVTRPNTPQIAVFDTAFHRSLPEAAMVYPGPRDWIGQGIRRYGFHGINHAWCTERAARLLPHKDPSTLRLIICHLGNGCSLAAVRGGKGVDTTMGFTPLEGLMMGSRSGSIDPGILLYLLRQPGGPTVEELDRLLNKQSGLKGISGISEDMREVTAAAESGNRSAQLALAIYEHRLRWHIGAMLPSLGGLDALVFTAGIGENSVRIRSAACNGFEFLGLRLEEKRNQETGGERDIAQADSAVRILVIPANEDWAIARECYHMR